MKKKLAVVLIALIFCLSLAAGCESQTTDDTDTETVTDATDTQDSDSTEDATEEEEELEQLTISFMTNESRPEMVEGNILETILLEDYNIVLDNWGSMSDTNTELPLMCASGDYPQWIYTDSYSSFPQLAYDGYFVNMTDYLEEMPNYKALYTDEQWENDIPYCAYDDGNVYYIPQKRAWTSTRGWLYRSDLFEENGLSVPTTLDELYDLCGQWLEIYDESLPLVSRGTVINEGIRMAYGAYNGVNAITGEYVAYYQAEDSYRNVLIYLNDLYEAGYIDPEYVTGSRSQYEERFATSNPAMIWGAVTWAPATNNFTMASDEEMNADPDWQYIDGFITATEDDEYTYYVGVISAQNWGSFFTDKIMETEGLFERMLEFEDWLCTDDGIEWSNWGVEGIHYEFNEDGTRSFIEENVDSTQSKNDGTPDCNEVGILYYTYWSADAITANYAGSTAWLELKENISALSNGYDTTSRITLQVPDEQIEVKSDYESLLATVADDFMLKFIIGTLDPADDDDWDSYISELTSVGLEEYKELMTELYESQVD